MDLDERVDVGSIRTGYAYCALVRVALLSARVDFRSQPLAQHVHVDCLRGSVRPTHTVWPGLLPLVYSPQLFSNAA